MGYEFKLIPHETFLEKDIRDNYLTELREAFDKQAKGRYKA